MGKTKLTGRIVYPDSRSYAEARQNLNESIQKFPCIIVFCQNKIDVKNALQWARERNIKFRVRSGRHSYENFSLVNDGLIIDVSEMRGIHYQPETQSALIQAGAELGQVYQQLYENRVTIPAGTVYNVGISGLTLGGGIGMLTRLFGLTCDNLEEVEIIVPSGKCGAKIIYANREEHSDLFWACCGGGGGNFGIVTAFKFRVHSIMNVSIFSITWKWEDFEEAYDAWQHFAPFTDHRLTSQIELSSKKKGTIIASGQMVGTPRELETLIEPLLLTGSPVDMMLNTVPFIEAVQFFDSPSGNRPLPFKRSGSFVYETFPKKAIQEMKHYLEKAPNEQTTIWQQALGGAVKNIAPEETAYFYRNAIMAQEYNTSWQQPDEAHKNRCWVKHVRKALSPYTKGDYVNWPDLQIKNWERAYYGTNFERLRRVKTCYDPTNVFCFRQSIPPNK